MTGLIPWRRKPKTSLVPFDRDVGFYDRFYLDPFTPFAGMLTDSGKWLPGIDIREKNDRVIVSAEIPGMAKKDLDVFLKGRCLTIKGEKTIDDKTEKKNFCRRERAYGYFERTVQLPDEVDEASVKAKYKRGVLTLDMRKTGKHAGKTIPIKTGPGR